MPGINFKDLACPAELGGSAGRASAWNAERHGFKSRPRQLFFFSWKKGLSLGIVAWICLVSMTDYTCIYMVSLLSLCTVSFPYLTFSFTDKYGNVYGHGGQTYLYHHEEDESSFQLVDTAKVQKPLYRKGRRSQVCVRVVLVTSTCTCTCISMLW